MLMYSPDCLRSLNHDRPPPRALRKAIFSYRLWKPRHRSREGFPVGVSAGNVNNVTHGTSGRCSSLRVGWLNVQSLTAATKSTAVNATIVDEKLDVMVLSETWHCTSDDISLRLATPAGFTVADAVRPTGPGYGGVAVVYRSQYNCTRLPLPQLSSFEAICLQLSTDGKPFILLSVYRPGSSRPVSTFYDELATVLESLVLQPYPVVIGGDFNIHVEQPTDTDAVRLSELFALFGIVQHVQCPTHRHGGTLDIIATFSTCHVNDVVVQPPDVVSDHSLVTCCLASSQNLTSTVTRRVRSWRNVDRQDFQRAVQESRLSCPSQLTTTDQLFGEYEAALREIADRLAPEHDVTSRVSPLSPWHDADCRAARRNCRQLERQYRRTRADTDRLAWRTAVKDKLALYQSKKTEYWTSKLSGDQCHSSSVWRSMNKILRRDRDVGCPSQTHTADAFLNAFDRKVNDVRSSTDGLPTPDIAATATTSMFKFRVCTEADVRRIIMASPTKTCALDPIPTFLLKEEIEVLLPFVTAMVNASLHEGHLPASQKCAIITPVLKKASLNQLELKNYRPISNLTFISKIVEKAVCEQLSEYLTGNGLLPRHQSAYRRHHSTETALLQVLSDIYGAADNQQVTLLGLLDLSAAFDCVDHPILTRRLSQSFGLHGAVLDWIQSFLTDRTQRVTHGGHTSSTSRLGCGVPQGSVCGPLLFILYTADLFRLIASHGLRAHSYADDTQVYISAPAADVSSTIQRFIQCVEDINSWMGRNRLKMNSDKTQVIWLGTSQQLAKVTVRDLQLLSGQITFVASVSNLGFHIDRELTMSCHVSSVCRSGFFQLRQLRAVRSSLTPDCLKMLVHAFVSSRLDYCNSLLYGVSDEQLKRLQSVQNAAARLISGTRKFDHISPVLRDLHWLPVAKRITYKLAMLVHKCLNGSAPSYLADVCIPVSSLPGRRQLRSAASGELFKPRATTNIGSRSFAVCGPATWNSLPAALRISSLSANAFGGALKRHLFDT